MAIVNLQIQIFFLIAIGYYLAKKGILDTNTQSKLTTMVLSVILPCAIVKSFNMSLNKELLVTTGMVLVISFGIQIAYYIINQLLYNKLDLNRRIICQYATMVSNAGFMGMPVAEAAFGPMGLLYASIFLIPQRIFMWSAGLSLFTNVSKKELVKKVMTHPCIIAIYIGVIVMILKSFQIELPTFVWSSINSVAACNTALSMIIIGSILSQVEWKEFIDKEALIYSFYRLIALPILLLIVLFLLKVTSSTMQVCVLLTSMPAASTTAMLAQSYERDAKFASKIVFVSTVLSLATLPIWLFVLSAL